MTALAICIAVATLGIDVGWKPLPEGGVEYIIQLDPLALEALRDGQPLQSDIHPDAGEVRSYRIIIGSEKLTREEQPVRPKPTKESQEKLTREKQPAQPKPTKESLKKLPKKSPTNNRPQPPSPLPAKPWLPLTVTLFGLFASLGANVYLAWIAWEFRQRAKRGPDPPSFSVGEEVV